MLTGLARFQEYLAQQKPPPRPQGAFESAADLARGLREGYLTIQQLQSIMQESARKDIMTAAETGADASAFPSSVNYIAQGLRRQKKFEDFAPQYMEDLVDQQKELDQTKPTEKAQWDKIQEQMTSINKLVGKKDLLSLIKKSSIERDMSQQEARNIFNYAAKLKKGDGEGKPTEISNIIKSQVMSDLGIFGRFAEDTGPLVTTAIRKAKSIIVDGTRRTYVDWENPEVQMAKEAIFGTP